MVKKKREKYGVVCGVLFFFIQKNKEVEWLPGWCWYGIGMVLLQAECSVVQRNITEVRVIFLLIGTDLCTFMSKKHIIMDVKYLKRQFLIGSKIIITIIIIISRTLKNTIHTYNIYNNSNSNF